METTSNHEGCLVCGQELIYAASSIRATCHYCGRESETFIYCPDRHFVCDDCHRKDALSSINDFCLRTQSKNPFAIAKELMQLPSVHMHGPEHHALVPAVLVAAFNNAAGGLEVDAVTKAVQRGANVPGGVCGNWGACGAAIGTGIAVSVITGATPLKVRSWRLANEMTSRALKAVAAKEGPRCCKRCSWTALEEAIKFIAETTGITLETQEMAASCSHHVRNRQCQKAKCVYYPG